MNLTNRPLAPSPDAVRSWLGDSYAALLRRRDELLAGYQRFSKACPDGIHDDATQGRAADFAGAKGMMGAFLKECDTARAAEKLPYRRAGEAVDGFFKVSLADPVEACQKDVRSHMAAYASRKEAEAREAARLEAERLAAEAALAQDAAVESMDQQDLQRAMAVSDEAERAAALAAATPAELSRVTGDLGTVASLRTRWVADIPNANLMVLVQAVAAGKAPLEYLQFNGSRIGYAVRSEGVREIPGVPIIQQRSVI